MADIGDKQINLTFTVNETNGLLNVLGQAPFVQVANLINAIQAQGGPQVEALQAEAAAAEEAEPKAEQIAAE